MFDAVVYDKLCQYCAYQERSTADVKTKLYALKISVPEYDQYLAKLRAENFLNDERYVKAFVSAHVKKKWGKAKIRAALGARQADARLVKKYLDEVVDGDYTDRLAELATKKWKTLRIGTEAEKKIKLTRFLLGRGFEHEKIKAAIKELTTE